MVMALADKRKQASATKEPQLSTEVKPSLRRNASLPVTDASFTTVFSTGSRNDQDTFGAGLCGSLARLACSEGG